MSGNARKLVLASFNIRFILFHVAGRISSSSSSSSSSSEFLSSARRDLFSHTVHKRWGKGRIGRDEAGEAGSSSQFPKQGLFSTRGKLNFRIPRVRRKFIYRVDRTRELNRKLDFKQVPQYSQNHRYIHFNGKFFTTLKSISPYQFNRNPFFLFQINFNKNFNVSRDID